MQRTSSGSLARLRFVVEGVDSVGGADLRPYLFFFVVTVYAAPLLRDLAASAVLLLDSRLQVVLPAVIALALAARLTRPLVLPPGLRLLHTYGGGISGGAGVTSPLEAMLRRRLEAAEGEREFLRVALSALRSLVPSASAVALFTLPSAAEGGEGARTPGVCVESFSAWAEAPARSALRDALRHVACEDPSTSVAFLCSAAAGASGGWAAADSRDWPEGPATFSDWAAAAAADAQGASTCFLTLTIAPTGGGGRKPAVWAALLRFENQRYLRLLSWLALSTGTSTFSHKLSSPPLPRDAAPLHRFCGVVGDALAARREKDAAVALSHVTALARDIYPHHLVGAMKRRHSMAHVRDATAASARSSGGALAAQDMLCESHDSVTVIFADVVGWTSLAGSMTPEEAMGVLDRLWQRLDTLSVAHGVYKVETIGDSYMAVSGMLPKRADHASAALRFALDMHAAAAATEIRPGELDEASDCDCLAIRVGLHTGPCTSGVCGNLRARFCLFGDTVNIASRMESTGRSNCVQLSDAAFQATGLPPGLLTARQLDVKGKGTMQTHVLEADTPAAAEVLEVLNMDQQAAAEAAAAAGGPHLAPPPRRMITPRSSRTEQTPRTSRVGGTPRTSRAGGTPRTSRAGGAAAQLRSPRTSVTGAAAAGAAATAPLPPGGKQLLRARRVARAVLLCAAPTLAVLAPAQLQRLLSPVAAADAPPPAPLFVAACALYALLLPPLLLPASALSAWFVSRLPWLAVAAHACAGALCVPLLLAQHAAQCAQGTPVAACARAFLLRTHAPAVMLAWLSDALPPFGVAFVAQLPAGGAYVAAAATSAAAAGQLTADVAAALVAQALLVHLLLVPLALLWALDVPTPAAPFKHADACPAWLPSLRRLRAALRSLAHRGRAAAGWADDGACPIDAVAARTLVAAHALAQLSSSWQPLAAASPPPVTGGGDTHVSTVPLMLAVAAASRALQVRAGGGGGSGARGGAHAASAAHRILAGERRLVGTLGASGTLGAGSGAATFDPERERAFAVLRDALTHASNDEAILRAGAAALAALFPDSQRGDEDEEEDEEDWAEEEDASGTAGSLSAARGSGARRVCATSAFALATFAEGSGVDVVASQLVVCADEQARRALSAALPPAVGAAQGGSGSAPSSVAVTCGAGSRLAMLDSRDTGAGLATFSDWSAAAGGGLRSRVAITVPLTAGPVVVGFVQVHHCGGSAVAARAADAAEARMAEHSTLREFCDAVGSSLFVRRAFALNRGGSSGGGGPARSLAGPLGVRRSSAENGAASRMPAMAEDAGGVTLMRRRSSESTWGASARTSVCSMSADDAEAWAELNASADEDRARLLDWSLDPWQLPDEEVERLVVAMFHGLGLLRRFAISPAACASFVADVAAHYNACPFHSWRHAMMVALAAWRFVVCGALAHVAGAPPQPAPLLTPLDALALLLAALCHDLEHPGTTNAFQVNAGTALALQYNDASVLENHHCARGFQLLDASGLLAGLAPEERKAVRKAIIGAILQTDMSVHKDLLARVGAKVDNAAEEARAVLAAADAYAPGGAPAADGADADSAATPLSEDAAEAALAPQHCFPTASADDRSLLVAFLLHTADLHNPLLPPAMSQRIAGELNREFAAQAEAEQAAGLPVTVMLAHTELQRAQLEISFIDYVVQPLYCTLSAICPALRELLERIETNRECWAATGHVHTKRRSLEVKR